MIGSARSERTVDRQGVAAPKEDIEPLLGAAALCSLRATRCIALPANRVCCVHQTAHLGQCQIIHRYTRCLSLPNADLLYMDQPISREANREAEIQGKSAEERSGREYAKLCLLASRHRNYFTATIVSVTPFVTGVQNSQEITHDRNLVGAEAETATFIRTMAELGDRLGPLLLQLPLSFLSHHDSRQAFHGHLHLRWAEPRLGFDRNRGERDLQNPHDGAGQRRRPRGCVWHLGPLNFGENPFHALR